MALMEYEVARARRYERPLTLAVVPTDALARSSREMRLSDLVAAMPTDGVTLVMLPETDSAGGESLVRRLNEEGVPVDDVSIVTFPDDGLTLADLIDRALQPRRDVASPAPASREPAEAS